MSSGDPMDVDVPKMRTVEEITAKDDGEGMIKIEDFPERMRLGRTTGTSTFGTDSTLEIWIMCRFTKSYKM